MMARKTLTNGLKNPDKAQGKNIRNEMNVFELNDAIALHRELLK